MLGSGGHYTVQAVPVGLIVQPVSGVALATSKRGSALAVPCIPLPRTLVSVTVGADMYAPAVTLITKGFALDIGCGSTQPGTSWTAALVGAAKIPGMCPQSDTAARLRLAEAQARSCKTPCHQTPPMTLTSAIREQRLP